MKKDVLIEVENTQTLGGRDEKYTVSVNGTLEYGDGRYTLAYTEYDGELKGCKTLVTVEGGDSVSVAREGGYSTELKLKNGERRTSVYSTPYGEFSLGLFYEPCFHGYVGKRRHARNRVHNRICPRFKGSQLNENNCF